MALSRSRRQSPAPAARSGANARAVIQYRKLALILLVVVVAYNEYYAYSSATGYWPRLDDAAGSALRIAIVADPQLQGVRDELPSLLGSITRWDSDRYLAKTFSWVTSRFSPLDAIVFLGDLIDEGSVTPDKEIYMGYVYRFRTIFPSSAAPHKLYTSGDNDVGGEGFDEVTEEKVNRFAEFFPTKRVTAVGSAVEVVVLNMITENATQLAEEFPEKEGEEGDGSSSASHSSKFRLAISHIPILPTPPVAKSYAQKVLKHVTPDVVLSAHHHQGMARVCSRKTGDSVERPVFFHDLGRSSAAAVTANLTHDREQGLVREITVPTCSYRMGVKEMAYGLLTLDPVTGDLAYYNLWLPGRFGMLYLYAATAALCAALLAADRRRASLRRRTRRRSSGGPSSRIVGVDYSKLV